MCVCLLAPVSSYYSPFIFWMIDQLEELVDSKHRLDLAPQDSSGKSKFRLGFPKPKHVLCNPGGCLHPGWGGDPKLYSSSLGLLSLQHGPRRQFEIEL